MTCILSPPLSITLADVLDIVDTALATISRRLPAHVGRDDLASVGKLALITSFAQCDGSADEVRAYCFVRVRGAMLDELRRLDPLTRGQRERATRIAKAGAALSARLGRAPTPSELSAVTGLPVAGVQAMQAAVGATGPKEIEWDSLHDPAAASPAETVESDDLRAHLRAALDRLPAKQAHALRRYYLEGVTLDAIAGDLGVSRERARQIREAGEKKLRLDYQVLALWQSRIAFARC